PRRAAALRLGSAACRPCNPEYYIKYTTQGCRSRPSCRPRPSHRPRRVAGRGRCWRRDDGSAMNEPFRRLCRSRGGPSGRAQVLLGASAVAAMGVITVMAALPVPARPSQAATLAVWLKSGTVLPGGGPAQGGGLAPGGGPATDGGLAPGGG